MGAEAVATVRVGGEAAEAKVLLETDEVIVRQPLKLKLPFADITSIRVDGDDLVLVTNAHGPVEIALGEKAAARWADKIANPPTLADKLGLKAGVTTALVGVDAAELGTDVTPPKKGQPADVLLYAADSPDQLADLDALMRRVADRGALWVVFRKGGAKPTENDVIAAGRGAGLTDTKVARWSATHTALRFVRGRARP
ncbi:MAG: hypothetical protein JWO37_1602 [Acidimicrobiales bacterium]|jgi:hypothetical protein|nr:hypothetical protein [Acidimicrobiales bacterium]